MTIKNTIHWVGKIALPVKAPPLLLKTGLGSIKPAQQEEDTGASSCPLTSTYEPCCVCTHVYICMCEYACVNTHVK